MSKQGRPVVAMVSDAVYPFHRGGKELRYHELAQRLAGRADVHIYTMRWWDGPRAHEGDAVTYHAVSRLYPLYYGPRRSFSQAILFAIACLRLLTSRFDVLEADAFPYLQIFALRLVTWARRKRLVVTWHEVWGRDYWHRYLGWRGHLAWSIERLAMRLPDHIIAASHGTAARLNAALDSRGAITVAPNGIDFDAVRNSYPDAVPTDLVVVGRLIAHKRFEMLLDVVAQLHAQGMPVTCRIIGDGPERAELHRHARALGIGESVDFRHDVREQKDVYALVKAAKVFVFPSAREGFGIAVLEALACGIPVVTTSAPDNLAQHLVARSSRGTVCDPSAGAITAAVRRVLSDPDARPDGDIGDDASLLAEHSWDVVADQVARALRI
jgi:glycosyltransferase involved in cell wall biosynthesis